MAAPKTKKFQQTPEEMPLSKKVESAPVVLAEQDKLEVGQVLELHQKGQETRYVAVISHTAQYLKVGTVNGEATFNGLPDNQGRYYAGTERIWVEV